MTTLREFQGRFRRALFADDDGFRGDDFAAAVPVAAAMAVYRNNVFAKLAEALGDLYPVVARLVGAAFFAYAARAFVRRHPPRTPVLAEYGDALPAFLDGFPPAASVPYLGDVARLELARHRARAAADVAPLAARAFKDIPARRFADIRPRLHPSLSLLHSPYPVDMIWALHQGGAEPDPATDVPARATRLLIARPRFEVETLTLAPAAFDFVAALAAGETLAGAFAGTGGGWNPQATLADLIAIGAFVDFTFQEGAS